MLFETLLVMRGGTLALIVHYMRETCSRTLSRTVSLLFRDITVIHKCIVLFENDWCEGANTFATFNSQTDDNTMLRSCMPPLHRQAGVRENGRFKKHRGSPSQRCCLFSFPRATNSSKIKSLFSCAIQFQPRRSRQAGYPCSSRQESSFFYDQRSEEEYS